MENVSSPVSDGRSEWLLLVACLLLVVAMAISPLGAGLLFANDLLGLMIGGAILLIAQRNGLALIPTLIGLLLVAANFANPWTMSPQFASFTCFAALVLLLHYAFEGWQGNWWLNCDARLMRRDMTVPFESKRQRLVWLWLSVPLMVVWANAHDGFGAGYALLFLYLVCRGLELASQQGWASLPTQRHFALILLAAGLATFLNPYGPGLHQWLLAAVGNGRPEITPWHPLDSWGVSRLAFVALISATILGPLYSRRPVDFTHLAVLVVVACQACNHPRQTPYLAMLFGFWVLPHVESVWRRIIPLLKQRNGNLVLMCRDQLAQQWGRPARFDNPVLADYPQSPVGEVDDQPQAGQVAWIGFPVSSNGEPCLASYSARQRIATKVEE